MPGGRRIHSRGLIRVSTAAQAIADHDRKPRAEGRNRDGKENLLRRPSHLQHDPAEQDLNRGSDL